MRALVVLGILQSARVQAQQTGAINPPSFDVVSIKLNHNHARQSAVFLPGGERFSATNVILDALILVAYEVDPRQLSGSALTAFKSGGYDIEAKADRAVSRDEMRLMLQALLADRFKLKIRRETKDRPVYALVVAKGGPKFHEGNAGVEGGGRGSNGQYLFRNISMTHFVLGIGKGLDRPIINKTGLQGTYDFELAFTPEGVGQGDRNGREPGPAPDGPSLFTALQEQLGLRLESATAPVDYLIVDHVEEPSAN
jgi:uncharacterized protein (TIGR03435 family)